MSFWRTFGFQTVSQVETILDRENFTLEELLDEEELLQEFKAQNKKLVEYLIKPETLQKLLLYLTEEPEENADIKRRSKYPFLACELLTMESPNTPAIHEAFFKHEFLLDNLYSYFNKDPPLRPNLVSHISKVAGVLIVKRSTESMEYLKKKSETIFGNFLKHLDNSAAMDLLIKIIASDLAESSGILQWLSDAKLVQQLIGKLNPNSDADVQENAAQTLVDIILVSVNPTSPLLSQLESAEVLNQLFTCTLVPGDNASLVSNGLTVIMELFKRTNQDSLNTEAKIESLPPVYGLLVKYLDQIKKLLIQPASTNTITLTTGTMVPLGSARLKLVEFILALVKTNYACIHKELIHSHAMSSCLELFFTFPWNNFLHSLIESILNVIFVEGVNQEFQLAIFIECQLLDKISDANKENEAAVAQPKGMRRGNMAYITRITRMFLSIKSQNEPIAHLLDAHEGWNLYLTTSFAKMQQLEVSPSGHKPLSLEPTSSEEEEAEEFDKGNSAAAALVFTQYLSQQGFSNVYPDDFCDDEDYDDELGERFFEVDNGCDSLSLFSTDEKDFNLEVSEGDELDGQDHGHDQSSSEEEDDHTLETENLISSKKEPSVLVANHVEVVEG